MTDQMAKDRDKDLISFPVIQIQPSQIQHIHHSRDSGYWRKLGRSLCTAGVFLTMGLACGQFTYFQTDLEARMEDEHALNIFHLLLLGYLTGCLTFGVLYHTSSRDSILLLYLGSAALGVSCLIISAHGNSLSLPSLLLHVEFGFCLGIITSCGYTYQCREWGNDRPEFLHVLQFAMALGQTISPLGGQLLGQVASPLDGQVHGLTILPSVGQVTGQMSLSSADQALGKVPPSFVRVPSPRYGWIVGQIVWTPGGKSSVPSIPGTSATSREHQHYATICVCCIVSVMLYIALNIPPGSTGRSREVRGLTTPRGTPLVKAWLQQARSARWPLMLLVLMMVTTIFMLFSCIEKSFREFLILFIAEKYNSIPELKSGYISFMQMYNISFTIGSFVAIFLSKVLSPARLVLPSVVSTIVLISLCHLVDGVPPTAVVVVAGVGMSAWFPAGLNWVRTHIVTLTAPVTSCILAAFAIGRSMSPQSFTGLAQNGYNYANIIPLFSILLQYAFIYGTFMFLSKTSHASKKIIAHIGGTGIQHQHLNVASHPDVESNDDVVQMKSCDSRDQLLYSEWSETPEHFGEMPSSVAFAVCLELLLLHSFNGLFCNFN